MNFLSGFSNMPAPVKVIVLIASGAGVMSIVLSMLSGGIYTIFAIAVGAVVAALVIWRLIIHLRSKMKAGSFALGLSRAGGKGVADPALKARMDDLRKKFEDGVETFKKNGKDLYSLPWYMIVGPSGAGKTEAIRHSNIGFPPGLQDFLQGTGGTLSMNWWFTNHAVIIDTAGRMFMEEGEGTEWKEFLKLLRRDRPNCPVNGLLLVISVENLLKDSTEKIEQTAGVIARQLDVIQRTLDVRFPVTAIVTKCDKITGFRDFFEMLNDPAQQHQILGWSNPASLDEGFKAEAVSQHLDTVRQKLLKRRMGLLQNPVHTEDPTARRTDQIDEMFELPNNLVRIAPRLKSYLEKIFVAGEWSPKPLFLRGIYFTSSMREGQALDMALAQSLGVDVESIPGAKEYPKEKAYFLRDVFMAKVFREKGLVTRATNVGKAMAKQRAMLAFGSIVAVLIVSALVAFTYIQFNGTIGAPSAFWRSVNSWDAATADPATGNQAWPVVAAGADGWKYNGGFETSPTVSQQATAIAGAPASLPDLLALTAESSEKGIKPPLLAKLGVPEGDIERGMIDGHRALVDRHVLRPLLDGVRFRLTEPGTVWDAQSVAAFAELIRVQTYTLGKTPASSSLTAGLPSLTTPPTAAAAADLARAATTADMGKVPDGGVRLAPLFTTLLGADESRRLATQIASLQKSVDHAAKDGSFAAEARKLRLDAARADKAQQLSTAAGSMVTSLLTTNPAGARMSLVKNVVDSLEEFQAAEKTLQEMRFVGASAGAAGAAPARETPATVVQYREVFEGEGAFVSAFKQLDAAKDNINKAVEEMNRQGITDPAKAFEDSEKELAKFVKESFDLLQAQLPATGSLLDQAASAGAKAGGAATAGAASDALAAVVGDEPAEIAQLRARLAAERTKAEQQVGQELAALRDRVAKTLPMLASGVIGTDPAEPAYIVRHRVFNTANGLVAFAAQRVAQGSDGGSRVNPGALLERAQGRADGSRVAIEKTANWRIVPTDRWFASAAPLEQARAASAASATRIIELASMKAKHEAVLAELSAEWLKSVDGIKAAVANDAADDELRRKGEEGDDSKLWDSTFWRQPRLAFTDLDGTEYDPQFHPGAAKRLLGAVGAIRKEVEGEGDARAAAAGSSIGSSILEPRAIRSDKTYIQATDFARSYAEEYVREWRRIATDSDPVINAWSDLKDGLGGTDAESINKALVTLRDQAREAIRVVEIPALRLSPEIRTSALSAVDAEFVDIEPSAGRQIISNWKTISSQDAAKAADRLRIVIEQKSKLDAWLRKIGPDDSYWNKLQSAMLGAVVGEADKDMKEARTLLLRTAKATPLVRGGGASGDLSAAQIAEVAQALAKMGVKAGPTQADASAAVAEVPDLFQPEALTLFGGDWSSDPARARWLEKLKYAVSVVNGGEMVLSIEHPGNDVPSTMEPPQNRQYAAIRVGGKFAQAKDGSDLVYYSIIERPEKVSVRLPGTAPVEILYFRSDPKGNMQNPDGQLSLTGPWPFLKEVLAGPSVKASVAGGWVVQVGQFPLRVVLPAGVDLEKWPTATEWPDR